MLSPAPSTSSQASPLHSRCLPTAGQLSGSSVQPFSPAVLTTTQEAFLHSVCFFVSSHGVLLSQVFKPPPAFLVHALLSHSKWLQSLSSVHVLSPAPSTSSQASPLHSRCLPTAGQLSGSNVQPFSPAELITVHAAFTHLVCFFVSHEVESSQVFKPPPAFLVHALLSHSK